MGARRKRPNITRAVREVMGDVARRLPEFAHIDPSRILVVAGEARRASRASVRPLVDRKPRRGRVRPVVKLRGQQALYCVTLRPLFFLEGTARERVHTILHELFHISTRFDGGLHAGRRHSKLGKKFERRLGPLVRRYLKVMPDELLRRLGVNGLVVARQWLEKPAIGARLGKGATRKFRRLYSEKQLFLGPVRMRTDREPPRRRPG